MAKKLTMSPMECCEAFHVVPDGFEPIQMSPPKFKAMDLALGETDRYANEMQVANNCQEEFAIWCRRHYLPKMDTKWRY